MVRNVVLVGGLVVLAAAGYFLFQGADDNEAPQAEDTAPQQGDPIVTVKLPAELSPKAKLGKAAFEAKCAVCHSDNAQGQVGVAPPLIHRTYEPGHHGDFAFLLAVQRGVRSHHWPFGDMPPVTGLTKADVANIVAYIRELQRENGIN